MIIHLSNNRFNKLFLTESKNSKRADKQTMQLIAQRSGWDINDRKVVDTQWFFRKVYFGSEGLNDDWFIVLEPNFCAAAIDKGLLNGDTDGVYNDLLDLIKYVHRKAKELIETKGREAMLQYISELKGNVNGWDTLYEMVGKALENERQEAMEKANQTQGGNSEYEIIGPVDFKEASDYGDYTAYQDGGGEICYTQGGKTWNSYTYNNKYAVYILVKPNWDELEPVHDDEDEESGYDTYGMSMIFVIVDEDGKLKTCNTRWNHEANYKYGRDVDFALDEVELSELVGRPFSEVFKPKTPLTFEERVERVLELINDFDNDLEEDDIENLFDSYASGGDAYKVEINGKWNFLIFHNDFEQYRFVSDQWFDSVGLFYKFDDDEEYGLGNVYVEGIGMNYVNNLGGFLLDEWLQSADYFNYKHATVVTKDGEMGIVDIYGNIFKSTQELFADIENGGSDILEKVDDYEFGAKLQEYSKFENCYWIVLRGVSNYVYNGKVLSPGNWFKRYNFGFTENGLCRVMNIDERGGGYNFLRIDGTFLLDYWVEAAQDFKKMENGNWEASIRDNNKLYNIDSNGNILEFRL